MNTKRIVIICPGNLVTGGPELIHQFVDRINENGGSASVLYHPFNKTFDTPEPYSNYNIDVCELKQIKNSECCFVIPETSTKYISELPGDNFHIWWLSVDNYTNFKKNSLFKQLKLKIRRALKKPNLPLTLNQMKKYKHWVQSFYAKEFLQAYKIKSKMLSDFLNEEHLAQIVNPNIKENKICYNPKKGYEVTKTLINAYPNFEFIPIQNMTATDVSRLLQQCKVYIDFGTHPGKDRIPREAAMAGCVVITGIRGSAKNIHDIAVDQQYKIDEKQLDFCRITGSLIQNIFDEFDSHMNNFEGYRNKIRNEKKEFEAQVLDFMKNVN